MGLFHFYRSVAKSCTSLCDLMDCSTLGFPSFPPGLQHARERWIEIHHYLLEFAQTHVHWVSDDIQSSHPLSPPSPPALSLSQHQGLFQWVGSPYRVTKVWSLSFNTSSSKEYSGLISLRTDWFDLLTVHGTLRTLLQHHSSKASMTLSPAAFESGVWEPTSICCHACTLEQKFSLRGCF